LPSASETAVRVELDTTTVVKLEHVSVTYRATYDAKPTLTKTVMRLGRGGRAVRVIEAVRDVSFDVTRGTVLGIIGVNGAGKSTLMRTIAGIVPPTRGRIEVRGRVSTLLALGVGFNRELSGRENVILGGLAAGLRKEQVAAKYDAIAEFAELGEFMDLPMRTYSSGMYGRLAFSVAVNLDPTILLLDEALSVGDAQFKRKSLDKMRELRGSGGTIIIVSHALGTIRELCDEVVWLNKGRLMRQGPPEEVVDSYSRYLELGEKAAASEEDL
jgi:ABC-type polysaccharide/polyol phosphate transport system ATPase subunit